MKRKGSIPCAQSGIYLDECRLIDYNELAILRADEGNAVQGLGHSPLQRFAAIVAAGLLLGAGELRLAAQVAAGPTAAGPAAAGQATAPSSVERRVYEGVASWRGKTIGTLILLEGTADSARGWIRLNTYLPLDSGKLTRNGAEFRSGANTYSIDELETRMTYSGPEGEGRRRITRLTRWTGAIYELLEATEQKPAVAKMEAVGRNREMQYGTPSLWKQQGPPFEKFPRLDEVLSKEVTVWVGEADLRYGRLVVVEEPAGMNIPLKAPKKEEKKEDKKK